MKRASVAAGVTVGVLLASAFLFRDHLVRGQAPAGQAKEKEKRTLTTSGSATVRVKPDSARVFLTVQTIATTIREARTKNNGHVKKVMDALAALKIANLKTKTGDVQVEMIYARHDRNETRLPELLGYRLTHTFTVLVQNEDTAKLGAGASLVLDTALENGVTAVQRVAFFRNDLNEPRRKALTQAVEDARANAQALASGARATITDTLTISG